MAGQQSDKFKFGMGDEAKGTSPTTIEPGPRGTKSTPVVLYIFLGILIIGMVAVYFDLYRRVTHSKSTGTQKLTRLAENLEDRFSSLSIKQAKLREQLTKKISDDEQIIKELKDEQIIKGLKTELKQVRADFKAVKKQLTSKADKSDLAVALSTIDAAKNKIGKIGTEAKTTLEKMKSMKIGLDAVRSNILTAKEDLSGEIGEINRQLDRSSKTLIELESRMDKLNTAKIDKKTAENLIRKRLDTQQSTSAAISKKISDYRDQIDANRRQITELKKNADLYESEILRIKRQLKSLPSGTSGSIPKKTQPLSSSPPPSPKSVESGDFSQQNLKE